MTVLAEQETGPQHEVADSQWLLERIASHTGDLADIIVDLVLSGELAPGARLPTVRALAKATERSVGSILNAWGKLQEQGYVQTRRRGGTVVLPRDSVPERGIPDWRGIDLAQNAPDLSLQPSLERALISSLDAETLNVFGRELMTERLRAAVLPHWPFDAQEWTTAGGGTEALLLTIEAAAPPQSTIAVDEPLGPGVLDTIRDLGLTAIGVSSDQYGPRPNDLERALAAGAVAFVVQPGAPFALEHTVAADRCRELENVLVRYPDVWIIEDDSIGPLHDTDLPTFGVAFGDRTVRIRSFCKAYGIDGRTSVVGGSKTLVERALKKRSHGVGSNSRILQNTLAYLINDPNTGRLVSAAQERYASRRGALLAALRERGLDARAGSNSLVVWVSVEDETSALVALARQGVSVGAGSRSFVDSGHQQLLRISATQLPDDLDAIAQLADLIAASVAESSREYFD